MSNSILEDSRSGEARLARAYLSDLEQALKGAGVTTREAQDTVSAIRERLEEALMTGDSGEVGRTLDALGPVEAIAAAGELPGGGSAEIQARQPRSDGPDIALLLCSVAALVGLIVVPFVAIPLGVATLILSALRLKRDGRRSGLTVTALGLSILALVAGAILAASLLSVSSNTAPTSPGPQPASITEVG